MSDLLSEVDQALRQDRAMQIWNKYGNLFIGGLIALILVTAAYSGYKHWSAAKAKENTGNLLLALSEEEPVRPLLQFAEDSSGLYKAIAKINAGHHLAEDSKHQEALTQFETLKNQKSIPRDFSDYAELNRVYLNIQQGKTMEGDFNFLETLMENKTSPWRFHARVAAAIVAGDVNGEPDQAAKLLEPLTSASAEIPESLKRRARSLHHVYSILGPKN